MSVGSLAGALVEWSDPLHASEFGGYPQRSLASFETYKMDVMNPPYGGQQSTVVRYTPDDNELQRMYEAARSDRIQRVGLQLRRALVTNGLIIVLSAALFAIHWRWLRRISSSVDDGVRRPA